MPGRFYPPEPCSLDFSISVFQRLLLRLAEWFVCLGCFAVKKSDLRRLV